MLCRQAGKHAIHKPLSPIFVRPITSTSSLAKKDDQLPPKPTLPDDELHHVSLKGSGPGGQKINKTSSAIQMTHLPTGIVVKSQATRSRSQNYTIARRILAEKVELLQKGGESRVALKQERVSKKKASGEKKRRRKYRKLEEGREGGEGNGQSVVEDEGDGGDGGDGGAEMRDGDVAEKERKIG